MTSLETLRRIFKSSFDYATYSNEIVHHLFGCNDVATTPEPLDTNAEGDKSHYIGQMEDADGRLLGFFYTRVANGGDVRRKRVGLRRLIQPYLKYDVDGAIAVFDDGNHWRLSYICDLKEGNTAAKRFSYILGDEQGQYKTPLERLGKVAEKNGRFKLSDLREAFSVDALSKEFFDEYHRHYDRICDYIIHSHINTLTQLHIHDYVKKMMGRIVFLHFLQKKGWLNGNLAFLRDLFFFSPHQGDFLEKVLEPLFFGIFNTEPQNREKVFLENDWDLSLLKEWNGGSTNALTHSHIDALPYLNGGLFERDAVDEENITLPASLFEDLFTFMASYNFTVDENDPDDAEVGVDPEMLGKIFESLLEDNKAKGAFYTPKEIVRYMCKESLIAYLSSRVSETPSPSGRDLVNLVGSADTPNCERSNANNNLQDQQDFASETSRSIRRFVETYEMQPELEPYRDTLDTALREVKICDPAIGSGAFPMGLLNELWRCREALYYPSPAGRDLVNLIDSAAASNCERGNAKDNLQDQQDFVSAASRKNEYSRSQLKKEIIENNIYGVDIEKGAIDIARLRFWLSIVVDADKPEPLPNFDYKFMQGNSLIESFEGFDLSRISSRLRGGQSKSMQLVLGIDSHTSRQNLQRLLREYFSVTDHKQKSSMRQAINEEVKTLIRESIGGTPASLAKLEEMDCSANQDFFLWHTWFKDIFDNGGFDIVIANPPYIDSETMVTTMPDVRQYYSEKFKTAKGNWDIFVVFIEHGLNISAKGGVFSFIVPNKIIAAKYATQIREEIENNCILAIRDYSRVDVFANASVYPCTIIGTKTKQNNNLIFAEMSSKDCINKYNVIPQATFNSCKYWDVFFNESHTVDIIRKYLSEKALSKYSNISVTAAATVSEAYQLKEIMFDADCLKANCLQIVNTGTIDPYSNLWGIVPMQYIKNKYLYPQVAASDLKQMNGNRLIQAKHSKIIVAGMSKRIEAILDGGNTLAGKSTTIVLCDDVLLLKYILGIINSKLSTFCVSIIFNSLKMAGGFMNVATREVQTMTIPNVVDEAKCSVVELVDKILTSKQANPFADTSDLEREIDQHVYALYNLTPEEIAIIEQ